MSRSLVDLASRVVIASGLPFAKSSITARDVGTIDASNDVMAGKVKTSDDEIGAPGGGPADDAGRRRSRRKGTADGTLSPTRPISRASVAARQLVPVVLGQLLVSERRARLQAVFQIGASQTSAVASSLPETTDRPSEVNAIAMTCPRCPSNRLTSRPVARSQTRTVEPRVGSRRSLAEASNRPSGEKGWLRRLKPSCTSIVAACWPEASSQSTTGESLN